jgi:hypothetical protein
VERFHLNHASAKICPDFFAELTFLATALLGNSSNVSKGNSQTPTTEAVPIIAEPYPEAVVAWILAGWDALHRPIEIAARRSHFPNPAPHILNSFLPGAEASPPAKALTTNQQ